MGELAAEVTAALAQIASSPDIAGLEALRVHWLGKKGALTEQLKSLGTLPAAERPAAGARINAAKEQLHQAIETRRAQLEQQNIERKLVDGRVDVTLPGRGEQRGGLH